MRHVALMTTPSAKDKLGTDLPWITANYGRLITAIALSGGGGVADAEITINFGRIDFANIYNSEVGDAPDVAQYKPTFAWCPPNTPILVECVDAPASGNLAFGIEMMAYARPVIGGEHISKLVSAATCVDEYDFADGEKWNKAAYPRNLRYAGLVGSTALGDTEIEINIGNQYHSNLFNTTVGASKVPTYLLDMLKIKNGLIRPNELLEVMCVDAADTQNVVLELDIGGMRIPSPRRRRTTRRRRSRRRY